MLVSFLTNHGVYLANAQSKLEVFKLYIIIILVHCIADSGYVHAVSIHSSSGIIVCTVITICQYARNNIIVNIVVLR